MAGLAGINVEQRFLYLSVNKATTKMSIQEIKNKIHHLVDESKDEAILKEVNRLLSGKPEHEILDSFTEEQLAGLEKAREEAGQGQGVPLADFKRKMETKWPQLKSL
jgi:hypothetical protein